jgi:hypothetical protein
MLKFHHEVIDPKEITKNTLQMCRVIREKHYAVTSLKKNSGTGGGPGCGNILN